MNKKILSLTTLAAALVTLAACSTTPVRNDALEQARSRYQLAQANPQVASQAPDEFKRATEALAMADKARTDGADKATIDHLAYMSSQKVTLAQDTAASKTAQAVTASAAAERDKMRLALRTDEADAAKQQLAASQESNAQKTAALAAADANAQRSDARVGELETQLQGMNARRTDRGMVVTLGDVLFDTGQSRLLRDGDGRMAKLADFFKQHPQRTASIEGYTDNVGSQSSNVELSRRRAAAVVASLVGMGVSPERLSTRAHGEAEPTASNATAAGRQLNRRVEVVFALPPEAAPLK